MREFLVENNFHYIYGIDVDYQTEYDCENNGCNDEGICRCGVIVNTTVEIIDLYPICSVIYSEAARTISNFDISKLSGIKQYCFERLAICHKLYDPENWHVETCGGYYGEEVNGVYIKKNIVKKLEEDILILVDPCISDADAIEMILLMEYKAVSKKLKRCTQYGLEYVSRGDIIITNQNHMTKIHENDTSIAHNRHSAAYGICCKINGKYILIDGHHRYAGIPDTQISIKMVVAS